MSQKCEENCCPVCGEGCLSQRVGECVVNYRGHSEALPSVYSVCDECGVEQASAEQSRDNKRQTIAFRKRVDGLLTGAELKRLRERLGLTQKEAASVFGGGPVAFSKYENDEVAQSESMDRLLRLADAVPAALTWLFKQAGVQRRPDWISKSYAVQYSRIGLGTRSFAGHQTVLVTAETVTNRGDEIPFGRSRDHNETDDTLEVMG